MNNIKMVDVNNMDKNRFKNYCADLLEYDGYTIQNISRGKNLQGIDIICVKDNINYVVLCKRYANNVPRKAIDEILSGMDYFNCKNGIVITNAGFTQTAIQDAEKRKIILWDKNTIQKIYKNEITNSSTSKNNNSFIKNTDVKHLNYSDIQNLLNWKSIVAIIFLVIIIRSLFSNKNNASSSIFITNNESARIQSTTTIVPTLKPSEVPSGARIYNTTTGEWQAVTDVSSSHEISIIEYDLFDDDKFMYALGYMAKGVKLYKRNDIYDEDDVILKEISYSYIGEIIDIGYGVYSNYVDDDEIESSYYYNFVAKILYDDTIEINPDIDNEWYWDASIDRSIFYIRNDDSKRLSQNDSRQLIQRRDESVDKSIYLPAENNLYPGVSLYYVSGEPEMKNIIEYDGILNELICDKNGKIIGFNLTTADGDIWKMDYNWIYSYYVKNSDPNMPK